MTAIYDKILGKLRDDDDIATLKDVVDRKQDLLVSGQNIKTVNGQSILGAGNLEVDGHFKGWFDSLDALQAAYPTPVVGDYAYIHDQEPETSVSIWRCNAAGIWLNSGDDVDTSNVQTFETGEQVNQVAIVNDLTTGGEHDVLSAEQGKIINQKITIPIDDWKDGSIILSESGFIRPSNGSDGANSAYVRSSYIALSNALEITVYGKFGSSIAPIAFYNSSKTFISAASVSSTALQTVTMAVPPSAKFFRVSTYASDKASFTIDAKFNLSDLALKLNRVYISPNGDDLQDGKTENTAIATFERASELIAVGGELIMLQGDYENAGTLDLSAFSKITGIGKVRIIYFTQKITSATLVSGNIYKATYSGRVGLQYLNYIYLHDIPDDATLIADEERHPLQKGQTHRMLSTRLYKVNSVSEIENETTHLCWYYEGSDIYFSLPSGINLIDNPIIIPSSYNIRATKKTTSEIRNVKFLYCTLYLTGFSGLLENVSCGMGISRDGQIICDYCKGLVLRNVEAFAGYSANGGDGVNTHNTDLSQSDRSEIILENCWLHDNADDGESCHENSLSIHNGCLVEYNGNGITPASGGSSECYNCIVRKNGSYPWASDPTGTGFSAQGSGASIVCLNCISENNKVGYNATETATNAVAYNSLAKDNNEQFYRFTSVNCTSIKSTT